MILPAVCWCVSHSRLAITLACCSSGTCLACGLTWAIGRPAGREKFIKFARQRRVAAPNRPAQLFVRSGLRAQPVEWRQPLQPAGNLLILERRPLDAFEISRSL